MNRGRPNRAVDLSWLAVEPWPLPHAFLWGVANAGYQVEGGYNQPGRPTNNWAAWEAAGKATPAGDALGFWQDWATHLDLAADMGLNAYRLSVEWTRVQPEGPSDLDVDAVARYGDILAGCRARGLEPIVTLHHFTHPAWAGPDPWLDDAGPEIFAAFARRVVPALNRALELRSVEPIRWWVTVNEPNILAFSTYVVPGLPTAARRGPGTFRRGLDGLLAGHVLAYRAIHGAHADGNWPAPMVAFNTYCLSAYSLDRGLLDIAMARELELPAGRVGAFLRERRTAFDETIEGLRGPAARLVDRLIERILLPDPSGSLTRYAAALESGEGPAHDYVGIDYYVAPLAHYLRSPITSRRQGRQNPLVAQLWETTIQPEGLRQFLKASAGLDRPLPVLVAENGMATRVRDGRHQGRADGWTRPAFLRAHLAELLRAAREGTTVAGYVHWTLADNFEWGSYEPRFGLHGVDRRVSPPRILATDAAGLDAAGAYRRIVQGARTGDGQAVAEALGSP